MTDLALLSYNLRRDTRSDGPNRWRHRRDRVAGTLRAADIAGLQEARWPMLRDLTLGAPRHRWVGVGRADGRRAGELVPVLWRADRFVAVDHGHFWLSSRPEAPGSKDHERAVVRMATWARLVERGTEQPLFVLNTHLDHRVTEAQVEGAAQIRVALDRLVGDEPVVVTGDLNARPEDEAHTVLTGPGHRIGLRDAYLDAGDPGPDTTYNGFVGPRSGMRIDVVLLSPHWAVSAYRVDTTTENGRFASDHFPVEVMARLL
jgi:endonuclease/exonuclease/phosphatase family metal-dependent hydrolase